jgi:UDP-N-acetylmuramoylalanine--D-glutamate ligase
MPLISERVRTVYTIGVAAGKIETQLRGAAPIRSCQTLAHAVKEAAEAARSGEVVLLAPACSSFDQFDSYEQRGRIFKQLVGELADGKTRQNG